MLQPVGGHKQQLDGANIRTIHKTAVAIHVDLRRVCYRTTALYRQNADIARLCWLGPIPTRWPAIPCSLIG